jgi:hypothetical protein
MRIRKDIFIITILSLSLCLGSLAFAQESGSSQATSSATQTTTTTGSTTSTSCVITKVGDPKTDPPAKPANCSTTSATGGSGGVPDGNFVYYCQGDPKWQQTCGIDQAGCGPTSLAMIISTLGKSKLSPVDVDSVFHDSGWRACSVDSGSNIGDAINSQFLAAQGLVASPDISGGNFVSNVQKATSDGKTLVIASSDSYPCHCGHADGSTIPASHIIVIQKVNADGTFAIRDPSNCDFSNGQEFTQFINVDPNSIAWKWAFAIDQTGT